MRMILAPAFALLLGASIASPSPVQAADDGCTLAPSDTRLYVDVQGLRNSKGLVAVTLYADDRSRFLAKGKSMGVGRAPAHAPNTRVCIHVPKPGVYALAIYHDEDGDRKFKRNGIGMPVEGFGFSNNPSTLFGLPSFASVRLNVKNGNKTTIKLRYP